MSNETKIIKKKRKTEKHFSNFKFLVIYFQLKKNRSVGIKYALFWTVARTGPSLMHLRI
jgi:hypothetical protein